MDQHWLYVSISGFVLGVLWRSFFDFGSAFPGFLILLGFFILIYWLLAERNEVSGKAFFVPLFIFALGLGVLRLDFAQIKPDPIVEGLVESHVVAEGIVVDEPDERENHAKLTVLLESVFDEDAKTKVLVTADIYPRFSYGDRISLSGVLEKPGVFETESGKLFDYAAFLAKDDIAYQMFRPEITLLSVGEGNRVKRTLFLLKRAFLENVHKVIPDPEVSLLGGLVVGAKQSLGEELQDDFRKTGIIHIVVLSGYNVTIVADAVTRFFSSFLPSILGASLGALSVVFFAILTGASATVVRASIMALLVILARQTGRTYEMTRALFLAGFFMVLQNPKILVFDPSFQLSFVATLGLIYLAPKLEEYFKLVPTKWKFREFATSTVATQLFVLPLLLFMTGEISLVALPVNLLILFIVPVTMLFGFLTGMAGFLSTLLSLPLAFITYLFLTYQLKVVDLFASLPFASISISTFPIWAALLVYVAYVVLLWAWRKPAV